MIRYGIVLASLVFFNILSPRTALTCDLTPNEAHQTKMNADPPLYFKDVCLTQLFDEDTNSTQVPAIKIKNDCQDTISFSPRSCDGYCLPFKLEPNDEVTLDYPSIDGLRDGQRKQDIYDWSSPSQTGMISLTSTNVEAAALQPCSRESDTTGCIIQGHRTGKRNLTFWLVICLLGSCLIRPKCNKKHQ